MSSRNFLNTDDTIISLATPSGVGAIAVIRISGKNSIQAVNSVFYGKDLLQQPSHTVHFGTIRDDERILDEVLVTLFHEGKSYTKEASVEISTHGSPFIIQEVIKLFLKNGLRMAQPGEFTKRAFLNGQFDLSQAEAVADLIHSDSPLSHESAMQQMRGGFSNEIKELRSQLIKFASLIELELDFSQEDVEFANRNDLIHLIQQITTKTSSLLSSFELGNVIKKGVPVVIVGRPNAGKSTLLNTLFNEEKAIVSSIAGTTRDFIEDQLNIEGITYRFVDTAGLRETQDEIESIGVRKTLEKMDSATIVLYLFDITETTREQLASELQELERHTTKIVVIANKMDRFIGDIADFDSVDLFISALEKVNIDEIKHLLTEKVAQMGSGDSETIVTNVRHYESLRQTQYALAEVLSAIEMDISGDLLAQDIKNALYHLGEITGEITTDDLLDSIFRDFCIGK